MMRHIGGAERGFRFARKGARRRWVAAALGLGLLALVVVRVALALPGDLDVSFDGDGKKTVDLGGADRAQAVVVQPNGRIVVAGFGNPDGDFAVTRLNSDGSFDTSFGTNGTSVANFNPDDRGYAVALQANGKIVVAGKTTVAGAGNAAVIRLNADGSLDASFDGDGKATLDYGGNDEARGVVVQPDGKIVVAGTGRQGFDIAVTRLNPDGSFDTTFNPGSNGGNSYVDLGGPDLGEAVALQANGKIVVAGYTILFGESNAAVIRLNADGSLDANFDGDGKATLDYGGNDQARGVVVQPDGKIVLAGRGRPGGDVAVTRLNPDGSLDTSFNPGSNGGNSYVDLGTNFDTGYAVALQADGKIVVAGTGPNGVVIRLNADGSLDTSFDFDGKKTVDSEVYGVALQSDGKILAVGQSGGNVTVMRLEGDAPPAAPPPPPPPPSTPPPPPSGGRVLCAGKVATIVGTAAGETLKGTRGADVIDARGGNDTILGLGGDDVVCAGAGSDTVAAGNGSDVVNGGDGADSVSGGRGDDVLAGGAGADILAGGSGDDILTGGRGNDTLTGGPGQDTLSGGPGTDKEQQ